MVQKTDPFTGEKFIPKRIDQKFATPQNRKRYYNIKLTQERREDAEFEHPQKKNKRILTALLDGKKTGTYHREHLRGLGFSFFAMTHHFKYEGVVRKAVYNFIIIDIGIDQIKIVKNG
ncbi:MAG TPA: hypothetical protein VD794_12055 [Flavisolibacter sp.]|nr:hypothetical protein [Flavisolibacter sp.]